MCGEGRVHDGNGAEFVCHVAHAILSHFDNRRMCFRLPCLNGNPPRGLGLGMPGWYANGGMQKAITCNLLPYVGLVMACLIDRRSLFAASSPLCRWVEMGIRQVSLGRTLVGYSRLVLGRGSWGEEGCVWVGEGTWG